MRRMNGDDNAVDREREVAITCSIFRRFHNIRLSRCRTLLSYFRSSKANFPDRDIFVRLVQFGFLSHPRLPPSLPSYPPNRSWDLSGREDRKEELNQCRTFILAGNRWLSMDHRGHIKISDSPCRDRGDIFIIACPFLSYMSYREEEIKCELLSTRCLSLAISAHVVQLPVSTGPS